MKIQSDEYPLVSFTVEEGVTPKTERYEREQLIIGDKLNKKYKVTILNDIVYNPANLKFGAINRNKFGKAVFSPIYCTFAVDSSISKADFIERIVTSPNFIRYALKYQQGTVYERQSVSPEHLLSMIINVPSMIEQTKVGIIFNEVDDLITLHQREYEERRKENNIIKSKSVFSSLL